MSSSGRIAHVNTRVYTPTLSRASEMDEEKLIEAIRSLPCLWQVSSKSYRDQRARENAWKEVAEAVSYSRLLLEV